jgi:hypothetical protein
MVHGLPWLPSCPVEVSDVPHLPDKEEKQGLIPCLGAVITVV